MGRVVYDPFSLEVREDPYRIYRRLRAEAPVYHEPGHDLWVLSRFDDSQAVMRDWRGFSNAEGEALDQASEYFGTGETGNFLASDPPLHTRFRGMVRELFAPKTIKTTYTPLVEAEVERLLDGLVEADEPDLVAGFAAALPAAVVGGWVGFPRRDYWRVYELSERFVAREVGNPTIPADAADASEELRSYVEEAVEYRRKNPSDDVVSWVLNATEREGFDGRQAREVVANLVVLFHVAGTETTTALIGNALKALHDHPDQRRLLVEDPGLMTRAVEEFMRWDSPAQHVTRTCVEEREFGGATIPPGARVMLLLGSANRDEDRWENSEELEITREPRRHLTFGEGIHHCIGASLARLEAPVALAALLRRWPDYEVSGTVERMPGFSVRGLKRLPARL